MAAVDRRRRQDRDVLLARRPRRRQPAARLGVAEQDVGERGAELLAAEPGEQHGRDVVAPRQEHGRAGVDDDDRARVGRGDAPHELVLARRGARGRARSKPSLSIASVVPTTTTATSASAAARDRALELLLGRPPGRRDPERQRREHRAGRDLVAQAERDLAVRVEVELGRALGRVEERRERVGPRLGRDVLVDEDRPVGLEPERPDAGDADGVPAGLPDAQPRLDLDDRRAREDRLAEPAEAPGEAVLVGDRRAVGLDVADADAGLAGHRVADVAQAERLEALADPGALGVHDLDVRAERGASAPRAARRRGRDGPSRCRRPACAPSRRSGRAARRGAARRGRAGARRPRCARAPCRRPTPRAGARPSRRRPAAGPGTGRRARRPRAPRRARRGAAGGAPCRRSPPRARGRRGRPRRAARPRRRSAPAS